MSFARGDLARRAALADNLAVPEPWSSNDDPRVFAAIRDLRDRFRQLGITDADGKGRLPDFLIDYENLPPIKPTALDRAHTRNSAATRWDQNGNLVEDSSDTLRLQRDPATGDVLGLLYEPKRTQLISAPQDITAASWNKTGLSTTADVGNAKGQPYDDLTEDTSTGFHRAGDLYEQQKEGDPIAGSVIVKANGRNFIALETVISNDSIGENNFPRAYFDLQNGVTGITELTSNVTVISHSIDDLSNGWYRCNFVIKPNSAWAGKSLFLELADGDGSNQYIGDGTSGIFVMHAQAEVSREVTTPILDGNATRGADEVDHRFDFPDKTTGVAYSIEQQAGGEYAFVTAGHIQFGTTSVSNDALHGVLMWTNGVESRGTDGLKTFTRNSDQQDFSGSEPLNETVDRFQVSYAGQPVGRTLTIRQIAIHTQPHTQAQKSALADQYLTQP